MQLELVKFNGFLFVSILILNLISTFTPNILENRAQATTVRFIPSFITVDHVGEEFTVACVIENVNELTGLSITFSWDTMYLDYVGHVLTAPLEDYPTPQTPSPYGGIIQAPLLKIRDDVNVLEGTYEATYVTLLGPSFNGSGTAFTITFRSMYVPFGNPGDYIDTFLNFTRIDLASGAESIPYVSEDGFVRIMAMPSSHPGSPMFKVLDRENLADIIKGKGVGNNFTVDVYLMGEGGTDVDAFWDVAGIDIYMHFDTSLLEAVDVTIDPFETFASFWPNGVIELANEIDNVVGTVHVAFLGLPLAGGTHFPPFGRLIVFSVIFREISDHEEFPPLTSPIYLENPVDYVGAYRFDAINGLIKISHPVGTLWNKLVPDFGDGPFELLSWKDDGDGEFGPSDQIRLNHMDTGFYFDYQIDEITGTLNLTQQSNLEQLYVEFDANYSDFLALVDPVGSGWKEVSPRSWRTYSVVNFTDSDTSGNITVGDYINMEGATGNKTCLVNGVSTGISTLRKPWVDERDIVSPLFGMKPIVDLAGFPHPERDPSPWYNHEYSVQLPHSVEAATYELGGIDDVATVNVSLFKTIVGQEYNVDVNASIANEGNFTETFSIILYANTTVVDVQIVNNMPNGTVIMFTLTWNTTGFTKGNYTTSVHIPPVLGEIDIVDNTLVDGWVLVTIVGDVDGDRDVDIFDIVAMAVAYGSVEGDPAYNPNYDLNGDRNIDIFDIVAAAGHYGESW